MNKSNETTRAAILNCLTEGMSVRATARVTGASRGLVLRILVAAGEFCEGYSYFRFRNLNTTRVEADEQWSYIGAKQRNATQPGHGDVWTFCAIDSDSKLVFSWLVGARTPENCDEFMADVAGRLKNRIQLSTDGHQMYIRAVRQAFGFARCDYARIVKSYGQDGEQGPERRYSPMVCTGVTKERMIGRPDMELVSTSYVERLNLDMRMNNRRFTRLGNGFSRSAKNHGASIALAFFSHNFIKAHRTLSKAAGAKTTPAMAAGIATRPWTVADIVARMDGETCQIGMAA
jgi:IS1 family transposase